IEAIDAVDLQREALDAGEQIAIFELLRATRIGTGRGQGVVACLLDTVGEVGGVVEPVLDVEASDESDRRIELSQVRCRIAAQTAARAGEDQADVADRVEEVGG